MCWWVISPFCDFLAVLDVSLVVKLCINCSFFTFSGSSYISAVNSDMSTKFGLLIDFELLKATTSINTKKKVVFSGRGRHDDIFRTATGAPIWTNFGNLMQNNMHITAK